MGSLLRQPASLLRRISGLRASVDVTFEEEGEFGTTDFTMTFKKDGATVSPWHDIPLEAGNGVKQDEKKGKARLYHGPIFWNYGCLPQTWEDPSVAGGPEVSGAAGDNDPLDVVEIGAASLPMGSFTPVKPLGVLSMIDDGELDWKLIAIAASDEHANEINDVEDI